MIYSVLIWRPCLLLDHQILKSYLVPREVNRKLLVNCFQRVSKESCTFYDFPHISGVDSSEFDEVVPYNLLDQRFCTSSLGVRSWILISILKLGECLPSSLHGVAAWSVRVQLLCWLWNSKIQATIILCNAEECLWFVIVVYCFLLHSAGYCCHYYRGRKYWVCMCSGLLLVVLLLLVYLYVFLHSCELR